jgi:L-2-amino-thiazoline-4-carboxylic acid hydrolase-like protein
MRLRFGNPVINIIGYFFLRNCLRELRGTALNAGLLVARIRDHTQRVFDASAVALPDKQAGVIYAYCSLVLAAFREVRAETGDEAYAYALARAVFQRTLEKPFLWTLKLLLRLAPDPVGFISRWSLLRLFQRSQGKAMEFAEEKTADEVVLVARRCAYHKFFVDHGEPALTPVLCVFDRVWMDILDRSPRPIRMERPSTISTGGDSCRFRFIRDHNKGDTEPVDIVLVQLQKPPYAVRETEK